VSELIDHLALLLTDAPADAEAVAYGGSWWRWGDVQRVARAVQEQLDALGVGPGGRVGVVLENRPQHVAALVGVIAGGRTLTTLSPLQPADRLAADALNTALPVVLASPEVLERPGVRDAMRVVGTVLQLDDGGTLSVAAQPEGPCTGASAQPGTVIEMLTSGTTGPPKRVSLTASQLDAGMRSGHMKARTVDGKPTLGSGVSLISTPLVHIGGLWGVLAAAVTGRRMVLLDRFRLDEWVHAIETYRPRAAGLVPAAMRAVLDADVEPERLSSLQVVTSGTAPCPAELATEFTDRYGIRVLMTYGATEFAGAVAGWTLPLHEEWWERKKGSTGRPFPGAKLRVVGADGQELPPDASGHLEVRSEQAPGGGADWIRTSDLARIDADGFIWIEGRADDAIIRGGFKVHPDVIKRVLEQHPAVQEAAVAGAADARLGSVPVAAVEIRPGAQRPTPAELDALCRKHLTPYEVPVAIKVVDELPRTAALKVSRVDLLELFGPEVRSTSRPRSA
jgi:acyl-CoA synthetase (AMP-forming)/AMP-acid ligase II